LDKLAGIKLLVRLFKRDLNPNILLTTVIKTPNKDV